MGNCLDVQIPSAGGETQHGRNFKIFIGRILCNIIFVIENGRKSDFPPAKNPTTSSFDAISYGDFGFICWGNQEKKNRSQILNSTTRTSDPCWVGRSTFITSSWKKGNGMRNLLGSCVRAFLVSRPARSSRSHGARVACGRRSQKTPR